jgi:hypothetical protein
MNTNHADIPWLGLEFFENRRKVPPEQLMQYAGQHIAWSWDGTRIVGSATTYEELHDKLDAAGIDTQRVVFSYVDPLDQVNL